MKKTKHLLSLLLCFTMVLSCFAGMSVTPASAAGNSKYSKEELILQCWNWPVSVIRSNLQKIADAGYTVIQTSCINGIVGSGNSTADNKVENSYQFYQPINFRIGNKICTKSEFETLCSEAKALGLKVIVDVVLNHTSDNGAVDESLKIYHNKGKISDWGNREQQTQYNYPNDGSGLPDLNTGNSSIQAQAKTLLQNILDAGASGFRFDAAKHIELPSGKEWSGCTSSDFWPNVLNGLQGDTFSYGEVLGSNYDCPYTNYADYMNLTGSSYSDTVRNNITNNVLNANDLRDYNAGLSGDNLICWVESHDSYKDGTYKTPQFQITRGYAAIAAQGLNAMYMARPKGSSDTNWLGTNNTYDGGNDEYFNDEVVGVNKFHNACKGTGVSNIYNYNGNNQLLVIERGSKGICFINTGASNISVNVSTSMANKTYKDLAHNTSFTANNGTLSGTVPPGVYPVAASAEPANADYYLRGSFNSWETTDKMTVSNGVATFEKQLSANTYTFKINSGDTWYGNSGTINDTTSSLQMDSSAGDCTLVATGGTYTFSFNTNTKKLTVTKSGSSSTTAPAASSTAAQPSTKTITVGVINYVINELGSSGWQVHYWGGASSGDVNLTSTGKTEQKSVGSAYWNNAAQTFSMFTASIPADATGFKIHNGDRWFPQNGGDGNATTQNRAYVFNYDGDKALYEYKAEPTTAPPTTVAPTTVAPTTETPEPTVTEAPEPSTDAPETTVPPTTVAPTTVAPTTEAPTTEAPEPTTTAPQTTVAPTSEPSTKLENGFYLIGANEGWDVKNLTSANKFSINEGASGEYMLTTTLEAGKGIKVVKVENEAITGWYPDGLNNDYKPDAAHSGAVTIYFQETYKADWSDFGGYIYIAKGETPESTAAPESSVAAPESSVAAPESSAAVPESTVAESTPSDKLENGFYLIGANEGWDVKNLTSANKFSINEGASGEYMLTTTLEAGKGIKVVKVENEAITGWYPDGLNNDYKPDAAHSGAVTIYFQETYKADWTDFGGYFYIAKSETPDSSAAPESSVAAPESSAAESTEAASTPSDKLENGFYLIGDKENWDVKNLTSANKFSINEGASGEYMLTTTLEAGKGIKVVKVENEAITGWYPDGLNNDYKPDAAHSGAVTIYFQETYKADWTDFGGYFYIAKSETPESTAAPESSVAAPESTAAPESSVAAPESSAAVPESTVAESTPSDKLENGFYLIGANEGWDVKNLTSANKFSINEGASGEYLLNTTVEANKGIKVVKVENEVITAWYPDGLNNDYKPDAAHSGAVTIYFQETYKADWSDFGGYFYIAKGETPDSSAAAPESTVAPESTEATQTPTDAPETNPPVIYSIGDKNINVNDTFTPADDDKVKNNINLSQFKNLEILGVQRKNTGEKSVRFVVVANNEIIQDADEYGFILAGNATRESAGERVKKLNYYNSDGYRFNCKGTSNNVSGDYGNYNAEKAYKYVTFGVNNIGAYAVAAKFYVKKGDNIYYATYTNNNNETFFHYSINWAAVANAIG